MTVSQFTKRGLSLQSKEGDRINKWFVLALSLICAVTLTACSNGRQEQVLEYSFHGENEQFTVSNGAIILDDTEEVFNGGELAVTQAELFEDIASYSTTFYTVNNGEQRTLLSNSVVDMTGGSVNVNGALGRISGDGFVIGNKVEDIDELKENLWFELSTTDISGAEKAYQLQLTVIEVTG